MNNIMQKKCLFSKHIQEEPYPRNKAFVSPSLLYPLRKTLTNNLYKKKFLKSIQSYYLFYTHMKLLNREWDLELRVVQERLEATAKQAHNILSTTEDATIMACKLLLILEKQQK